MRRVSQTGAILTRYSLALYAAWLSVATWLNLGDTLAGYGLTFGITEPWRSVLVLAGALGTATFFIKRSRGHWSYGATIVWALVGVLVANGFALLGWLAVLGMVVVGLATLKSRPRTGTAPAT